MKIEDVKIDPEFKSLIDDGHTVEQIAGLKADIKERGFRDAIVVWEHHDILLDGHTRYGIWEEDYKGKSASKPPIITLAFPDKTHAKRWMLENQLNRRNLNQTRAAYYRGLLHNELKLDRKENLNRGDESPKGNNCTSEKTSKKPRKSTAAIVAAATGVSERTIKGDAAFAKAVDKIATVNSKAASDIKDGKLADKKSSVAIAKLSDQDIGKAIGNLRNGREWSEGIDVPKPGKGTSPAKHADELSTKYVSPLARGLDKLAEINGGKGEFYAAADQSLNAFVGALKKMREGKQ